MNVLDLFLNNNAKGSPMGKLMLFGPLLSLLGGIGFFTIIPEGFKGLRMRFGHVVRKNDVPIELGPGFHWQVPWAHSIQRIDVRPVNLNLVPMTVRISEFEYYTIDANVAFKVDDIYKKMYATADFETYPSGASSNALYLSAQECGIDDIEAIEEHFAKRILETGESLGVTFSRLHLTNTAPNAEMLKSDATYRLAAALKDARGMAERITSASAVGQLNA